MNEWHWQEHFAGQHEILAYINHVVEKYDLRKVSFIVNDIY